MRHALNKGRIKYLSKDENAEKFRILLKDPSVLKSNKSAKYQVLMIQRNAFSAAYAEGRTKEIYEENKKYMTTYGFVQKEAFLLFFEVGKKSYSSSYDVEVESYIFSETFYNYYYNLMN